MRTPIYAARGAKIVSPSGEWTVDEALDRIRTHAELNIYAGGDTESCLRLITDLLLAAKDAVEFERNTKEAA